MRNEFISAVCELAAQDERVVLLTGDLGFTVLDEFVERFPDRFFNAGVAEQNMIGMATGLAEAGLRPFVYSIATFATMRAYEFIRNGAVLHDLPVRIVGVGAGIDYGHNGATHYALEDVALMRAQPGLTIVAPADAEQAQTAVRVTASVAGPIYYRVSKTNRPVPGLGARFALGRADLLGDGDDVALVALGSMAGEAAGTQRRLARRGVTSTVAVISSVSPPPVDDLVELLSRVPLAVSVECHYATGGLGSLVAEIVADHGLECRLLRLAVTEVPRLATGSEAYLTRQLGLDAESISEVVWSQLRAPVHRR